MRFVSGFRLFTVGNLVASLGGGEEAKFYYLLMLGASPGHNRVFLLIAL